MITEGKTVGGRVPFELGTVVWFKLGWGLDTYIVVEDKGEELIRVCLADKKTVYEYAVAMTNKKPQKARRALLSALAVLIVLWIFL